MHLLELLYLYDKIKKLYIFIYTLKGNFGSLAKVILNLTRFFDIFDRLDDKKNIKLFYLF